MVQHKFLVVIRLLNLKSKTTHRNQFQINIILDYSLTFLNDDSKQILALAMIFISECSITYYYNLPSLK
ncbi:unnamed protein product (macronuclear) [Paramecium tetraurelia]|uniref:Cyclin N-terminal domain-containing protein n=1 Tax=Paramecium tetraurelia TaxID=5888 RepID=A0E0C3_PARTE|nr:uncharacterized protein GSPATT00021908001 [Paramecium tetraurelia]CAK88740.1 unnamed protein product [Paramecium tetraurelia]|eukprot:XP_001456137.1 hypothetical protein (macronuclear) [Paramecium tetraurelia strain d4-2]